MRGVRRQTIDKCYPAHAADRFPRSTQRAALNRRLRVKMVVSSPTDYQVL